MSAKYLCLCLVHFVFSGVWSQDRNIYVEGNSTQLGVFHSFSGSSGIDLLKGNEKTGVDWRILNKLGQLRIFDTKDNFQTPGDENLSIKPNGTVLIKEGTEATLGDDSGVLILGDPSGQNLALDQNEILARYGSRSSNLYIQAGLGAGHTFLNLTEGNVGIGKILGVPESLLSLSGNGFQFQITNEQDNSSNWYIGASKSGWSVGPDKLVFSPSASSSQAMLVIDDANDVINVKNNRVTKVADPVNDGDAVNLGFLESTSYLFPKEISPSSNLNDTKTFKECAEYCNNLTYGGHNDWGLPTYHQLVQYAKNLGSGRTLWTTDIQFTDHVNYSMNRIILRLSDGVPLTIPTELETVEYYCRCVR